MKSLARLEYLLLLLYLMLAVSCSTPQSGTTPANAKEKPGVAESDAVTQSDSPSASQAENSEEEIVSLKEAEADSEVSDDSEIRFSEGSPRKFRQGATEFYKTIEDLERIVYPSIREMGNAGERNDERKRLLIKDHWSRIGRFIDPIKPVVVSEVFYFNEADMYGGSEDNLDLFFCGWEPGCTL